MALAMGPGELSVQLSIRTGTMLAAGNGNGGGSSGPGNGYAGGNGNGNAGGNGKSDSAHGKSGATHGKDTKGGPQDATAQEPGYRTYLEIPDYLLNPQAQVAYTYVYIGSKG